MHATNNTVYTRSSCGRSLHIPPSNRVRRRMPTNQAAVQGKDNLGSPFDFGWRFSDATGVGAIEARNAPAARKSTGLS